MGAAVIRLGKRIRCNQFVTATNRNEASGITAPGLAPGRASCVVNQRHGVSPKKWPAHWQAWFCAAARLMQAGLWRLDLEPPGIRLFAATTRRSVFANSVTRHQKFSTCTCSSPDLAARSSLASRAAIRLTTAPSVWVLRGRFRSTHRQQRGSLTSCRPLQREGDESPGLGWTVTMVFSGSGSRADSSMQAIRLNRFGHWGISE